MTKNTALISHTARRAVIYGAVILIGIFCIMQFVRFIIPRLRPDNPPVMYTVNWDSSETEQLWKRSCADCHSNETVYPWYSYVAPIGWLVTHDVHDGRSKLNISESRRVELREAIDAIREDNMPPTIYTVMHPAATLTDAEKQALITGLQATFTRTSG